MVMNIDSFLCGLAGQAETSDGVPAVSILMDLFLIQRHNARRTVTPADGDELRSRRGIESQISTEGLDVRIDADLGELTSHDAVLVGSGVAIDVRRLRRPLVILVDTVQALCLRRTEHSG